MFSGVFLVPYYTIPKIKRELKQTLHAIDVNVNYTIPKRKGNQKGLQFIRRT